MCNVDSVNIILRGYFFRHGFIPKFGTLFSVTENCQTVDGGFHYVVRIVCPQTF